MKPIKFISSCSLGERRQSRSLHASHYYYECCEQPKSRASQASIMKTEISEKQKRILYHHKTMLIDKFRKQGKNSQNKQSNQEKMFDICETQRRLSCCCNECGRKSAKMKKFHNVYEKLEKPVKEFWSSLNLKSQQQSVLTVSTKSLKSTATMVSLPEMSPSKLKQKIESPRQKKIKQKLIPSPSITFKPYLYEPPQSKVPNILTEQTYNQIVQQCNTIWRLKPVSLRASAPNLETIEYSSKNSSPRRGVSNQNVRQDSHVLTQRIMTKKFLQNCYLKRFTGINIRQNIMSTQRIRDNLLK